MSGESQRCRFSIDGFVESIRREAKARVSSSKGQSSGILAWLSKATPCLSFVQIRVNWKGKARMKVSRRRFVGVASAALVSINASRGDGRSRGLLHKPKERSLLFYKPPSEGFWDHTLFFHSGQYFLIYQIGEPSAAFALSSSLDGLHWRYHEKIFSASEHGLASAYSPSTIWSHFNGKQTIFYIAGTSIESDGTLTPFHLESRDLLQWKISTAIEYIGDGNFGIGMSGGVNPRRSGGYEAFADVLPTKNGTLIFASLESDDGLKWHARKTLVIEGLNSMSFNPREQPELGGALEHAGRYYFLAGLNDLDNSLDPDERIFTPGCTTLISDTLFGPVYPSPKNRILISTNNSYFLRFSRTNEHVLVHHQSYIPKDSASLVHTDAYYAPLKLAHWDDEGNLRLKYWSGNDKAKTQSIMIDIPPVWNADQICFIGHVFPLDDTFIVEGTVEISRNGAVGLYFCRCDNEQGSAFLIHADGTAEFGSMKEDHFDSFVRIDSCNREIPIGRYVKFRLLRRALLVELYVDDFLMYCYALPDGSSGKIGLIGRRDAWHRINAWYCHG
jgi:hypothetical protein